MHLKQLDIVGFKSFPDRIRLEFQPGLTAVVGPNGSGKSNIADAVRWVMGETSAKSLRGVKMEDVIFSGTEHRRPLGYAEVVMTVDNADHLLPVAFDDVTVTRRVYRSGESEFALNGTPCRLKDIQMLFMDTGVGREGYSIIGQGRIDEILSVRSEDRRLLFEEAAGIVKFKTRRNEALNKLERERQNLVRVNDIVSELAVQMEPLAVQSEQAKKYLLLKEQYKLIHINIFLEEVERIQAELHKWEEALSQLEAQSESGRQLLTEASSASETLKLNATAADARYKQASERLIGIITEIEKQESAIKLLESQLLNEQSNQKRLDGEIEKRARYILASQAEYGQEDELRVKNEEALTALNEQLKERQAEFAALDEAMRMREQALDGYNKAVMEKISAAAEWKSKVREAENAYERLEEAKERINSEMLHNDTMLLAETERQAQAAQALARIQEETQAQQDSLTAYEQARSQLLSQRESAAADHRKTQSALQECSSRHKVLTDLEAHHEGYYRSVKAVLKKKREDARFSGICGAVSELIQVPREYETAIEIALGGAAQNIITQTEADAKLAIGFLKESREGRATFLPLTSVKGRTLDPARLNIDREPGFIGIASALVNTEYSAVIAQLLGNVIVFDTLDHALSVHKKTRYTHKIVTLDGELLSPGGAMTGGSVNRSGLIGRSRQLAELTKQLAELKEKAQIRSTQLLSCDEKIKATEDVLTRVRERMQALLLEQNNERNQLNRSNEQLAALNKASERLDSENEKLMGKLVETNASVRAAKQEWAKQEESVNETRRRMDEYQRQISEERGLKDEQVKSLTDLRVEISRRTEQSNRCVSNLNRLIREKENLMAEQEALRIEKSLSEEKSLRHRDGIEKGGQTLVSLQAFLVEQRHEQAAIEYEKAELETAIERAKADERVRLEETARLDREIDRLHLRKEQLDVESRRLYDEIWDEYALTYQTALEYKRTDMSAAFMKREDKRLRAELLPLTEVNVGAIEAFRTLKTRYDFLTAQRDDIVKAENDLKQVADTLTKQMESRFIEQFSQISNHFNDVFREMFGGGKAGLRLLDENHILESGIEINAQPPGKSLQTLLLLSGGERALTAIALLFAILRMKPSPFCLLDEIEAALDDANVARFAQFLKEYARGTQFITITHRKGTMEAADALYGVTMQELGISKLVSVKLVDVA